jgi:hypothetical protein
MFHSYEDAFAYYAPIYRHYWRLSRKEARDYARADILATLKLHDERTPYVGKLYAELDAIRDADRAYQQRRTRR